MNLPDRGKQQFTAQTLDQFSVALASQPSFSWSRLSGPGAITRTGLYTAPSKGTGTAIIQAKAGGKVGKATITIGASGQVKLKKTLPGQSALKHGHR